MLVTYVPAFSLWLPGAVQVTAPFTPSPRYPDPALEVLRRRLPRTCACSAPASSSWPPACAGPKGPVWFGDGRYLLLSDIPNNRILRWDDTSGATSVFRAAVEQRQRPDARPPGPAAGLRAPDAPRHAHRIRRPHHRAGRPLRRQAPELAERHRLPARRRGLVHRPDRSASAATGRANRPRRNCRTPSTASTRPTGRCNAGDRRPGRAERPGVLARRIGAATSSRAAPRRTAWLWAYDVAADGALSNKRLHIDAAAPARSTASRRRARQPLVRLGQQRPRCRRGRARRRACVRRAPGVAIGHIHLPERCANVCFGGAQEQPALHGEQPFAVRAVRQRARARDDRR